MQEILTELKDVISKWFKLGVFLGIPSETLIGIKHSGKKEKDCKLLMLIEWSKHDIPTWEKLVTALIKTGLPTVAVRIATNHRKSFTIIQLIKKTDFVLRCSFAGFSAGEIERESA